MTVSELIEILQEEENPNAEVRFALHPADPGLEVASVYSSEDRKVVWIDLEK